MQAGGDNNLMAESVLTELLNNNKKLLDNQINFETIENFVKLCFQQGKNERFMRLLSSLCCCQGEAVISKQNAITEILLEREINKKLLLFEIKFDEEVKIKIEKEDVFKPTNLDEIEEVEENDEIEEIAKDIEVNTNFDKIDDDNQTINVSDISHIIDDKMIKELDDDINEI